jgi:hypothetical protein
MKQNSFQKGESKKGAPFSTFLKNQKKFLFVMRPFKAGAKMRILTPSFFYTIHA